MCHHMCVLQGLGVAVLGGEATSSSKKINNSGADKDCGIITHIKSSAERASTESYLPGSAGLPGLDMILPKTRHWTSQQCA